MHVLAQRTFGPGVRGALGIHITHGSQLDATGTFPSAWGIGLSGLSSVFHPEVTPPPLLAGNLRTFKSSKRLQANTAVSKIRNTKP